jgi:hypothetical protein
LAQIAAKEDFDDFSLRETVPKEAEGALIVGRRVLEGPEAVGVVVQRAAVACLCAFGDLKVSGRYRANALIVQTIFLHHVWYFFHFRRLVLLI